MTVTIYPAKSDLRPEDIEAWRGVPVSIAVDLAHDIGQIDPALRPLNPPGKQPRLFGRALTASRRISGRSCMRWISSRRATCWSSQPAVIVTSR